MADLTPEQKLDEIYSILKHQETRRKAGIWYRILKWIILAWLVFFIATNPGWILGKMTDIITPIIMENMKTMMEDKKSALMESMKNMLPTTSKNTDTPY